MSETQTTQVIGTGYAATLQGVCKILEAVASFIAALLVGIEFYGWVIDLFEIASIVSCIVAVFLFVMYMIGTVDKIRFSWNRFQFFFHLSWAIFYLIAAALVFDKGRGYTRPIVGAVFGIIAILAHIVDGVDNYKKNPLF